MLVRLSGPSDWFDNDQNKVAAYLLDIWNNGHFFVQQEEGTMVASKPPMYQWLAYVVSCALGAVSEASLKMPSVLAGLGVVWLTYVLGARWFGRRAGGIAAVMMASHYLFAKGVCLARTDMLLTFFTVAGIAAWDTVAGQGSSLKTTGLFWFLLACNLLTKGPVGPALVAVYILVTVSFEKQWSSLKRLRTAWGLAGMLLICGAWFFPAWHEGGDRFIQKVFVEEFYGHLLGTQQINPQQVRPFWYLWPHFVGKIAPWSLVFFAGCWYWRSRLLWPVGKPLELPVHRPVLWTLAMMLVFGCMSVKRPDYMLPLSPAVCLLAGVVVDKQWRKYAPWPDYAVWLSVVSLLIGSFVYYHVISYPAKSRQGEIRRQFAAEAQQYIRYPAPLSFYDQGNYGIQFLFGYNVPPLEGEQAFHELLSAAQPAYLVTELAWLERAETELGIPPWRRWVISQPMKLWDGPPSQLVLASNQPKPDKPMTPPSP